MEVVLENHTPAPETTVCKAARNDYSEVGIQGRSFGEIMEDVDFTQEAKEWARENKGDFDDEELLKAEARKYSLIQSLLNHGHYGPFEHPQFTFSVNGVSRSLMAQLTRHRHATFDIQSMRYVSFENADPEPGEACVAIPELETAEPAGRNVEIADYAQSWSDQELLDERKRALEQAYEYSFKRYQELLDFGVAPENARMVLPIGTKVNIVFSVNARMLMHIADMRAAADAQWEIREMTEQVLECWGEKMPVTYKYYNEYMKNRKNRLAP